MSSDNEPLGEPRWPPIAVVAVVMATDVLPLTHRAKYAMLVQATVAIALFGLVIARAVNAFT